MSFRGPSTKFQYNWYKSNAFVVKLIVIQYKQLFYTIAIEFKTSEESKLKFFLLSTIIKQVKSILDVKS